MNSSHVWTVSCCCDECAEVVTDVSYQSIIQRWWWHQDNAVSSSTFPVQLTMARIKHVEWDTSLSMILVRNKPPSALLSWIFSAKLSQIICTMMNDDGCVWSSRPLFSPGEECWACVDECGVISVIRAIRQ